MRFLGEDACGSGAAVGVLEGGLELVTAAIILCVLLLGLGLTPAWTFRLLFFMYSVGSLLAYPPVSRDQAEIR